LCVVASHLVRSMYAYATVGHGTVQGVAENAILSHSLLALYHFD